jgi:hypothetical protein
VPLSVRAIHERLLPTFARAAPAGDRTAELTAALEFRDDVRDLSHRLEVLAQTDEDAAAYAKLVREWLEAYERASVREFRESEQAARVACRRLSRLRAPREGREAFDGLVNAFSRHADILDRLASAHRDASFDPAAADAELTSSYEALRRALAAYVGPDGDVAETRR